MKEDMRKKLYLSRTDRKLAGVCGGIADYLDVDTTVIRIVLVLLTLAYGIGPMAYVVIWAIAPKKPENDEQQQNECSRDDDHYDKG